MNKDWKTDIRKDRHHITQEDFTPPEIVDLLLDGQDELFSDFSKTFLDPCIGIGFIYIGVLKKRFEHCKTSDDILDAIRTMYGTELMQDNVDECKLNIISCIRGFIEENELVLLVPEDKKTFIFWERSLVPEDTRAFQPKSRFYNEVQKILDHNIVCTDTFKWDYENWCPIKEEKAMPLF